MIRLNLISYWRKAARWFCWISAAYVVVAALVFAAFEGDVKAFRLTVPQRSDITDVLSVGATWVVASWVVVGAGFVLVSLVALDSKRWMGDYTDEYTGLVRRRDGSVLAQAREVPVTSSVWTGPVRFLRRARFAWKPRCWPPPELVNLMSTEDPLVAPDGSGVWYHAGSGYSVVLTRKGLVTWIERRDIRPDLLRYMDRRRRGDGKART